MTATNNAREGDGVADHVAVLLALRARASSDYWLAQGFAESDIAKSKMAALDAAIAAMQAQQGAAPKEAGVRGYTPPPVPSDAVEARAQGRAEALAIILSMEAETGLDDYTDSVPPGPSGEWGTAWNEDKLRELLRCDDSAWSLMQAAEGEYWHNIGLRMDAEHTANPPVDQRQEGAISVVVARQLIHDAYQSGVAGNGYTPQVEALYDAESQPCAECGRLWDALALANDQLAKLTDAASPPEAAAVDDAMVERVAMVLCGTTDWPNQFPDGRDYWRGKARMMLPNILAALAGVSAVDGEAEMLARWLDAKWRRHGEIEDKQAADLIRKLTHPAGRDAKDQS